jgi:hypothetical protein
MCARIPLWTCLIAVVALTSCSTGSNAPAPGSPAFYWSAAKTAYHAGDFRGASQNLNELIRGDNEFTVRARPLAMLVSAGLAKGYADMADAYEAGAKANRANPTPFLKQVTASRSMASAAAMDFVEGVHVFLQKDKDQDVLLACEYPTGSMPEPAALRRAASGIAIQDSEREGLEAAMLQRGVLQTMTQMVGAPDDPAKTLELFKGGEPKIPRDTFVLATAKALYEASALFGSMKMDQPNRLEALCNEADEALKSIPETKDTKALASKIQTALKKTKKNI